jgi:hypothetical protein
VLCTRRTTISSNVSHPAFGAPDARLHPVRIARPRDPNNVLSLACQEPWVALARRSALPARSWQATAPTHGPCLAPVPVRHGPPDSPAFAPLQGHSIPPTSALRLHCVLLPLRKTAETGPLAGAARTPGQRITRPSCGNAHKFAGLRCDLVMRCPPTSACPPPKTLSRPTLEPSRPGHGIVRSARQHGPASQHHAAAPSSRTAKRRPSIRCPPSSLPDTPCRHESGQLLLRLRCSCLRVWAFAELAALTPPPMLASPLAVRAPR